MVSMTVGAEDGGRRWEQAGERYSGMPPIWVAMTGRPQARASRRTLLAVAEVARWRRACEDW